MVKEGCSQEYWLNMGRFKTSGGYSEYLLNFHQFLILSIETSLYPFVHKDTHLFWRVQTTSMQLSLTTFFFDQSRNSDLYFQMNNYWGKTNLGGSRKIPSILLQKKEETGVWGKELSVILEESQQGPLAKLLLLFYTFFNP